MSERIDFARDVDDERPLELYEAIMADIVRVNHDTREGATHGDLINMIHERLKGYTLPEIAKILYPVFLTFYLDLRDDIVGKKLDDRSEIATAFRPLAKKHIAMEIMKYIPEGEDNA